MLRQLRGNIEAILSFSEWPLGAIIYETERQSLIWCARSEMVTSASYKVLTPTGSFVISISIILIIL